MVEDGSWDDVLVPNESVADVAVGVEREAVHRNAVLLLLKVGFGMTVYISTAVNSATVETEPRTFFRLANYKWENVK